MLLCLIQHVKLSAIQKKFDYYSLYNCHITVDGLKFSGWHDFQKHLDSGIKYLRSFTCLGLTNDNTSDFFLIVWIDDEFHICVYSNNRDTANAFIAHAKKCYSYFPYSFRGYILQMIAGTLLLFPLLTYSKIFTPLFSLPPKGISLLGFIILSFLLIISITIGYYILKFYWNSRKLKLDQSEKYFWRNIFEKILVILGVGLIMNLLSLLWSKIFPILLSKF